MAKFTVCSRTSFDVEEQDEMVGLAQAISSTLEFSEDLYSVEVTGAALDVFSVNYTITMSNGDSIEYVYKENPGKNTPKTSITINGNVINYDPDVPQDDIRREYVRYLAFRDR